MQGGRLDLGVSHEGRPVVYQLHMQIISACESLHEKPCNPKVALTKRMKRKYY